LRLAGGLSGRFSGPLARFVPGVLDLVIAPTDASLFRRKRISHVCQLLSDLLSYLFLSLSSSSLTVGSELRTTEQNNYNRSAYQYRYEDDERRHERRHRSNPSTQRIL
jgi:hypothetical protein